jgi:hypothetical protein
LDGASCSAFDFGLAIRTIGLALNASNGCVATDDLDVQPDEMSWRINHSEELLLLADVAEKIMESALIASPDLRSVIAPLRGGIDQSDEDILRDSAKSVSASIFEANYHAESQRLIADGGDSGGLNGDHIHNGGSSPNVKEHAPQLAGAIVETGGDA